MEFKKKYRLAYIDLFHLNLYCLKKRLAIVIPIIFVLMCIVFIINIESAYVEGPQFFSEYVLINIPVILLLTGALFLINILIIKTVAKKEYNSNKTYHVDCDLMVNDEGISRVTEYTSIRLKWQDLYKAAEDKHAVYFFLSKLQAIVIPKQLVNDKEYGILKQLAKSNMGIEKNKLK